MSSSPQGTGQSAQPRPPDVFLIGVPRSGTTSLYYSLREHPQVFAPDHKEACFTCRELDPGTKRTQTRFFDDRDEYLALFAPARRDQVIVEGCIYNVYSGLAPARLLELNPAARVLVQLRDPVQQMYSNHALKLIMRDIAQDDFESALDAQAHKRSSRRSLPATMREFDLRDKAAVSSGLAGFYEALGRDRIHVTLYENFRDDPDATLRGVLRFVGVDDTQVPSVPRMVPNRVAIVDPLNRIMGSQRAIAAAKRVVPRPVRPVARRAALAVFRLNRRVQPRPPLDIGLRDRLRAEFRDEVDELSRLVDIDLAARWWSD